MQSIDYNYEECITNLSLIICVDLWKGPHLDDMKIESSMQSTVFYEKVLHGNIQYVVSKSYRMVQYSTRQSHFFCIRLMGFIPVPY